MASSGGMRVDPDSLMASGSRMISAAERIRTEVASFQAELAGFGEPWGGDDLGSLIGMVYQAIYEVAMECYGDNAAEIDETGGATRTMATGYRDTEQANSDLSKKYLDALGG